MPEGGSCGTKRQIPSDRARSANGIPACGLHKCDDPAVRNTYLVNSNTPVTTMNLNVIFFGNMSGTMKTTYDTQISFLRQEYMKFFKIGWNISTTVVTDRYQEVGAGDPTTHEKIATEFYIPGKLTLIWTVFNPNPDKTFGYTFNPQDKNLQESPATFYCILDIATALTPTGTTLLHELGHMFGLVHPFLSLENCNSCAENLDTVNRDIVGDFCNDTLPGVLTYKCDSLTGDKADCSSKTFTDLTGLPLNNYMSYTPDSCQNTFTPQQAARVRCYLDNLLQPYVASGGATPTAVPTNAPTTGTPVKTPITKAASGGSRVGHVLVTAVIAVVTLLGL